MKFCENCGAQLEDNAVFCPNCGAKVGEENNTDVNYRSESASPDLSYHPQKSTIKSSSVSSKSLALISYLWLPGLIIAIIVNATRKDVSLKFYINQALWLFIISIVTWLIAALIPPIGTVLLLILAIIWLYCFIGAAQGKEAKVPFLGDKPIIK